MRLSPELEARVLALDGVVVRDASSPAPLVDRQRVQFAIECRTVSEANQREHWAVKFKRNKSQQEATWWAIFDAGLHKGCFSSAESLRVTFERIGRTKMDSDNLAGAFKHIRDAVARWLDVDDGDERIHWVYRQWPEGKGKSVLVTIERMTAAHSQEPTE